MLLVLRAFLCLSLASTLLANKKTRPRGKMVKLFLDPSVQTNLYIRSMSNIASMSLSPWTYQDNINTSRIPTRISQAECLTSYCLSLRGNDEDLTLEAKPIVYEVLVLHRVSSTKSKKKTKKRKLGYRFTLGTEVITVGCTCVRPSYVNQN
ncbi:interleukin-17F [Nothobranchius furzeri]|uniref:Interleukin-17F-like n=2 Tax=Nothobranchius furzeri TaxID=105023 RepID=A0A8C6LE29_NOTFU|nr:interleukin 17a/f3 [Nothobranchius furzeri]KAF7231778.1 interleukin-17F-like [Nothobranchius furzeri]